MPFTIWNKEKGLSGLKIKILKNIYFYASMCYNLSVKGSFTMNNFEKLRNVAEQNGGVIRTSDALYLGISKPVFANFIKTNNYERVSHGIYCSQDYWTDDLYLLQLRCPQTIFSHDTALFLLNMTDREPLNYTVTAKTGYNSTHLKKDNVKVFTVKKDLFLLGTITLKTPFGHDITVYDAERTLCDMIRSRNSMEIQSFQDALKQYVKRKDKKLHVLMEYAKEFHIENKINQYMEVLL